MPFRVVVTVRERYDNIRSPSISDLAEATVQIAKIQQAVSTDAPSACVELDWLCIRGGDVLAAYLLDESDESSTMGLSTGSGVSTTADASPSSGEPYV
jgi:hypothetical protein